MEPVCCGRVCVRAEARRRGKERVGRGGDMLLLDLTMGVAEVNGDVD